MLQTVAFQLSSLLLESVSGRLNTQNCKDVRLSVDAGGGKLTISSGQRPLKSKQTSTVKKKKIIISGNVGMTH